MSEYDSTKNPGVWLPVDAAAVKECKELGIKSRGRPVLSDPDFQLRASRYGLTPEKYLERLQNEHKLRQEEENQNLASFEKEPVDAAQQK